MADVMTDEFVTTKYFLDAQITKFCYSWCFVGRASRAQELHYDVLAQFTALVVQPLSVTRANLRVSCGM